jgi:hypothetical protein
MKMLSIPDLSPHYNLQRQISSHNPIDGELTLHGREKKRKKKEKALVFKRYAYCKQK